MRDLGECFTSYYCSEKARVRRLASQSSVRLAGESLRLMGVTVLEMGKMGVWCLHCCKWRLLIELSVLNNREVPKLPQTPTHPTFLFVLVDRNPRVTLEPQLL